MGMGRKNSLAGISFIFSHFPFFWIEILLLFHIVSIYFSLLLYICSLFRIWLELWIVIYFLGLWWGGGKGILCREDTDENGNPRAVTPIERENNFLDFGSFLTSLRGAYYGFCFFPSTFIDLIRFFYFSLLFVWSYISWLWLFHDQFLT